MTKTSLVRLDRSLNSIQLLRYSDDEIREILKLVPDLYHLSYTTKRDMEKLIASGKLTMHVVGEKVFLIHQISGGSSMMLFIASSGNTKILRDTITNDYKRFIPLMMEVRTSK